MWRSASRHFTRIGSRKRPQQHWIPEEDLYHEIKCPPLPPHQHSVILGLGSNLGNRVAYIEDAIRQLRDIGHVRRVSSMYETAPIDMTDQPHFLNACVEFGTALGPQEVLVAVKGIESRMGRQTIVEKGPRNIDIDIVLYGDQVVESPSLTIPHIGMMERPFVLAPLQEVVDKDRKHPHSGILLRRTSCARPPRYVEGLGTLDRCLLMGVVNVTPDSFSDGGLFYDHDAAVAKGMELVEAGAAIVDIGGESSRPDAEDVSVEEELRRVIPVVERLAAQGVKVSIDTRKQQVAEQAVKAGAVMINDISFGTYDDAMIPFIQNTPNITYCGMHMRGSSTTMDKHAEYKDVVSEVRDQLAERSHLTALPPWRLLMDPGIGFAKNPQQSLQIMQNLDEFRTIPAALLVGFSRKRVAAYAAGVRTGKWEKEKTFYANLALTAACASADVLRMHDVAEAKIVLDVLHAVRTA
eukprot:GEMP01054419.1.p1 GENE.GEMP01054419.1~~GEMP01054419.1.p1  ORF type:complete len:473 (+),score=111.63 GEMP01054419.1:23-1420(+)